MRSKHLVVAAGLPPEIGHRFVSTTLNLFQVISWTPLPCAGPYTDSYSTELYGRLAAKLKARDKSSNSDRLAEINLLLMYLDKRDGSESTLLTTFGTEALPVPLNVGDITTNPLTTGNHKKAAVNYLTREAKLAFQHARLMLSVIEEEVTNRENRTCLLLPQKNFGADINRVFTCIHDAAVARPTIDEFKKRLRRTSQSLRTAPQGQRKYFEGKGKLVFVSPPKAAARHGLAVLWNAPDHTASCVIRGRLRFGAPFDPKFHYDCQMPKNISRTFPTCHGIKKLKSDRKHVNIAPNDYVR